MLNIMKPVMYYVGIKLMLAKYFTIIIWGNFVVNARVTMKNTQKSNNVILKIIV